MATLQKCCKCHSAQELKYYSINKKGQLYLTCDKCRNKYALNKSKNINPLQDVYKTLTTAVKQLDEILQNEPETQSEIDETISTATTTICSTNEEQLITTKITNEYDFKPKTIIFDVERSGEK
jgi:recombinational DNA repair protein (RecF pathway)